MTREQASDILDDYDVNFDGHTAEEVAEAFDVAVKALEQEPCEDAISRQAVLEQINCWIGGGEYDYTNATHYLTRRMQELPSVTPQRKTGYWIPKGKGDGFKNWNCSKCGMLVRNSQRPWYKHCPNCGAKMEREVNEMSEQMKFPESFEKFAKEYGFKDDKEVYTNGSDLIPIFRVKQWLEKE